MYAFIRTLKNAQHVRRYTIQVIDAGWEVRAEQDSEPLHRTHYHDWHRVERAKRSMLAELDALTKAGWREETA